MNVGCFAMDPGGSTGLAWGIFDPLDGEGVAGALRSRMHAGSTTVTGDERTQIREIANIWQSFYRACVRSALLPPDRVWLVCEDFIYNSKSVYGGNDSSISTALIWGVEGYRLGRADERQFLRRGSKQVLPSMVLQTAGMAKQYANDERLREWDCWVVGRDHERSAWRHIALFLSRFIQLAA